MMNQSPQGLASLGRNGDTMLMHVSPREVQGLQSLAMAQGGSLTINPDTGLPEAFKLSGFFKSLLPTLAGAAASFIPGMQFMSPVIKGILAGATTGALTNKDNRLLGAITGGLGGYGGANLGSALSKMGGSGLTTPAISSGQGVQLTANNLVSPNLTGLSGTEAASALDASVNNLSSTLTTPLSTGTGGAGINYANAGTAPSINIGANALDLARPPSGFESMLSGAEKLISPGGYDAYKEALTFSYFNCFPQNRRLNRGVWKIWETTIRQESQKWPLRIYCGGIYTNAINTHSIGIPTYCWKLVINLKTHLISHVLLFKNDDSNSVQRISFSDLKKLLNYTVDFKTN